ncbi:metal ABC transporter solute-binding protein, Zn/Mn family [Fusibacter sp. 3D3]|uniref:metal ABC transporter solute-binding protein, Zn/Mn family n=1 Tax=Fusibacter sp. 3D3 TaxID=1048380 RepID=UPI00085351A4|nr:zinc ABC transporter substrate-binding protein [Fusibacter sp. 3D3]GAU75495.1 zinc ABC transporter, periplasmic-binding protein ZnuA [Fusibacter sp. 3D3]
MTFNYKRIALLFILTLSVILYTGCATDTSDSPKLKISTGILPIKAFTAAIGGSYVEVEALIPVGANPHNYQPSPSAMKFLSDAKLYIYVGVPTENENIMPKIKDFNTQIEVLNLQEALAEVHPFLTGEAHDHEAEDEAHVEDHPEMIEFESQMLDPSSEIGAYADYDPHTWVSPKRAITMAGSIRDTLIQMDPDHEADYQANADALIQKLSELDQTILDKVSTLDQKTYLIYHSSYNYFAFDYGLSFISIENEGKSPTIQDIQNAIDIAKENRISTLFYQNEFSVEQAKSISEEIEGNAVPLEPLSEKYFDSMALLIEHLN